MFPSGNKSRVLWSVKIHSDSLSFKKSKIILALEVIKDLS